MVRAAAPAPPLRPEMTGPGRALRQRTFASMAGASHCDGGRSPPSPILLGLPNREAAMPRIDIDRARSIATAPGNGATVTTRQGDSPAVRTTSPGALADLAPM